MMPKIYILIVTWNSKNDIKQCLDTIMNIDYPSFEIIVVDNASSDGTPNEIRKYYPFITIIQNKYNLGYTGGNNVGIKYIISQKNSEYVLIMNDDIIVTKDFLKKLIFVAESNNKIGVVGPSIYYYDKPFIKIHSYSQKIPKLGISFKKEFYDDGKKIEKMEWIGGATLLIKLNVIKTVGIFDEKFFMYGEEQDWCTRVLKKGYEIVHVPFSKVYHKVPLKSDKNIKPYKIYYNTRNELLYAKKHLNMILYIFFWIPRFIIRIIYYSYITRDIKIIESIINGAFDFFRGKFGRL